jgi:hypothetical protein
MGTVDPLDKSAQVVLRDCRDLHTCKRTRDLDTTILDIESQEETGIVCCLSSLPVRSICMYTVIVSVAQFTDRQRTR